MSAVTYLVSCVVAMKEGGKRRYRIVASGRDERECEIKALKIAATFHEGFDSIIVEEKEQL